jgi:chromate transport protein ChrA
MRDAHPSAVSMVMATIVIVHSKYRVQRRALPGLNAAAVGLIVAAVFQLGLQIYNNSPFPNATLCIGQR